MMLAIPAILLLTFGALCLYAAAPHQVLTTRRLNAKALRLAGAVALVAALVLLLLLMGPAAAVFTWITGMMLLWSVPPVVLRWARFRKENIG